MAGNETGYKAVVTAAVGALSTLWSWMWGLVCIWVFCMVLDYISGSVAAARRGEWSSKTARDGLFHKGGMIIVVTAAALADITIRFLTDNTVLAFPFPYTALITPIVITWYIITELGSTLENAAEMGGPVPDWLLKFMRVANATVNAAGKSLSGGTDVERDGGTDRKAE